MSTDLSHLSQEEILKARKKKYLEIKGMTDREDVIDCNPDKCTITFMTEHGPMTRQLTECWTRVMGYFRPSTNYNKGKLQEFNERKNFKMPTV